jgi:hypothetical protein
LRIQSSGGFSILNEEWPSAAFEHLDGKEANVMSEVMAPSYTVNGKHLHTSQYFSFGGQVSTFVADYLGAPVSLLEILEDMGQMGATYDPASSHAANKVRTMFHSN